MKLFASAIFLGAMFSVCLCGPVRGPRGLRSHLSPRATLPTAPNLKDRVARGVMVLGAEIVNKMQPLPSNKSVLCAIYDYYQELIPRENNTTADSQEEVMPDGDITSSVTAGRQQEMTGGTWNTSKTSVKHQGLNTTTITAVTHYLLNVTCRLFEEIDNETLCHPDALADMCHSNTVQMRYQVMAYMSPANFSGSTSIYFGPFYRDDAFISDAMEHYSIYGPI